MADKQNANSNNDGNNNRRRSARISRKRKIPLVDTAAAISRKVTRQRNINPDYNPYRKKKSKHEISSDHLSVEDDDEECESITPAITRVKKEPELTFVSVSTSTSINDLNKNNTCASNTFISTKIKNGHTEESTKGKGAGNTERNSLRRLTVSVEKDIVRKSKRSSLSYDGQDDDRSSTTSASTHSRRKFEQLRPTSPEVPVASTRGSLSKLESINTSRRRKSNLPQSVKLCKKTNDKNNLLPPVFDYVPKGVFDLDSMYKSTTWSNASNNIKTQEIKNEKLTNKEKTNNNNTHHYSHPTQILHLATYDGRGTPNSHLSDIDTSFLAHYSTEYYNFLFQKEKQSTNDSYDGNSTRRSQTRSSSRTKPKIESQSFSKNFDFESFDNNTNDLVPKYMKTQKYLSTPMRAILVDWLIEISDEYKLKAYTLHIAVKLMDRALEVIVISRKMLQCLGCACMLTACKLEEVNPMTSADFVYVSDKSYTRKEITKMEHDIFHALKFQLYEKITPFHFLHRFRIAAEVSMNKNRFDDKNGVGSCIILDSNPTFQFMVEYLLELTLLQPDFVDLKPSLVAATAIYLGRATLGIRDFEGNIWNDTLSFYTTYKKDELEPTVYKLHSAHKLIHEEKLSCVVCKYKHKNFHSVALKPAIMESDLGFR